ncbi:MAG: hypothetical protein HYV02_02110 [Deltaproteobacteria bacterium]|nr:hypothetical protein [Deltaproteobacteria bacterium]
MRHLVRMTMLGCVCGCFLLLPRLLHAGGPWFVDEKGSGVPYTWAGGTIIWYADAGGLGAFSGAEIIDQVKKAFDVWMNAGLHLPGMVKVNTVQVSAVLGGILKEKLTPENLMKHLNKTLIIYDEDGSILTGEGVNPQDVAAVTFLGAKMDPTTLHHLAGVTVLNGLFLQDVDPANPGGSKYARFLATLVHEFGHLFNLDHSALNWENINEIVSDIGAFGKALPTMYPVIVEGGGQETLHVDDVVAISTLYPRADFTSKFCAFAGVLVGSDSLGFQGAHVVARPVKDPMTFAISAVSGNALPQGAADGSYIVRGILPGEKYTLSYGKINPAFVMESSLQPYGDEEGETPRSGFENAPITAGNGKATTVLCNAPGETVMMDTIQLEIPSGGTFQAKNPLVSASTPMAPPATATGGSPGGDPETKAGAKKTFGCTFVLP